MNNRFRHAACLRPRTTELRLGHQCLVDIALRVDQLLSAISFVIAESNRLALQRHIVGRKLQNVVGGNHPSFWIRYRSGRDMFERECPKAFRTNRLTRPSASLDLPFHRADQILQICFFLPISSPVVSSESTIACARPASSIADTSCENTTKSTRSNTCLDFTLITSHYLFDWP